MDDTQGSVKVTPLENGPNLVEGSVRVLGPDGQELEHKQPFALCRCGGSEKKPFCDGTHRKIGFQAPGINPAAGR